MKNALPLLFLLLFVAALCEDDSPTEPATSANELTISHWGVDWSSGKVASEDVALNYDIVDGETIGWCPNGNGGGWESGIWYRSAVDRIMKLGNGNLSSYSALDTTNWDFDVCDTPLKNGDVWAAKCRDGFVIFKVKEEPDIKSDTWKVKVEYKFSDSIKF